MSVFCFRWDSGIVGSVASRLESPVIKTVSFFAACADGSDAADSLAHAGSSGRDTPGGLLGHLVSGGLLIAFNTVGANLVGVATFFAALYLTTSFSLIETHESLRGPLSKLDVIGPMKARYSAWREAREQERMRKRLEQIKMDGRPPIPSQPMSKSDAREDDSEREASATESERPHAIVFRNAEEKKLSAKALSSASPRIAKGATNFRLPSPSLLRAAVSETVRTEEDELKECARAIELKMPQEFDIGGRITQINPGPVVTTYELKPEAGIKYSRITGLAEDLCLALKAESILIERIPRQPR